MTTNEESFHQNILQEVRESGTIVERQSDLKKSENKASIAFNVQESVRNWCLAAYHVASTVIKILLPLFFYTFIAFEIKWIIDFISSNPDKFDSQSLAIIIGSIIIQPFLIARIITNALYFSDNSSESKKVNDEKNNNLKKLKDFISQLEGSS